MQVSFRGEAPDESGEPEEDREDRLIGTPFMVNGAPVVFWDRADSANQRTFLDRIDTGYFTYIVDLNLPQLNGENKMRAAAAIRIAYSHAIETLFAFIGAAIQAPTCPAGWLLKYKNPGLKDLVSGIVNRREIPNKLELNLFTWEEIAHRLTEGTCSPREESALRSASAQLWKWLAREFTDELFIAEYNSLKHGFRVGLESWFLALGLEDTPGVPAPPERMRQMAFSPFGSSFLRDIEIKQQGPHWKFEQQRLNWNPAVFAARVPIIADSAANVISFLKLVNGHDPACCAMRLLTPEAVSAAMHDPDYSFASRFSLKLPISPTTIPRLTKEEVRMKCTAPRSYNSQEAN